MIGDFVRVRVTHRIGWTDPKSGFTMPLNFGRIYNNSDCAGVFIIGVSHSVYNFSGRIIAVLKKREDTRVNKKLPPFIRNTDEIYIIASRSSRFIIHDIKDAINYDEFFSDYDIQCLYECSCGAIVFRKIAGETRFLLIKNKRSAAYGFPKGHMEKGETTHETAKREVLEETGLNIDFIDGFEKISKYVIRKRVEKNVHIFIATTKDSQTKIQIEEISDYLWLPFSKALSTLKFDNDKKILVAANIFLKKNRYI